MNTSATYCGRQKRIGTGASQPPRRFCGMGKDTSTTQPATLNSATLPSLMSIALLTPARECVTTLSGPKSPDSASGDFAS